MIQMHASCFGSADASAARREDARCDDASTAIHVREAVTADRDSILVLVTLLVEFGPPPWRDPGQIVAAESETLGSILASSRAGASILVAVDAPRARGYRLLTIQLFAKNRAADALCESTGFVEETITFRKSVR